MNDYRKLLEERIEYANEIIERYLPKDEGYLAQLAEAMNYSVMAGGKRLRPVLIDSVYRFFGGRDGGQEAFMAAMEYLHTYSLVHDDMPAIDNDDMRRGMPTTHKRFGEACALLAGDGLLHWSNETALKAFEGAESGRERIILALRIFAEKSGPHGMLGGQSVDVLFTGKAPDRERLDFIYRLKTCALIEGSMMIGAALAGAGEDALPILEDIGRCVGLAFQIKDDILDCGGDTAVLGKPVGSDAKNEKTTYATLFGTDRAQEEVRRLTEQAVDRLKSIPGGNEEERQFLIWLVKSLVSRTY